MYALAIALGAEQYGLTAKWMDGAELRVRIPMLGTADSLNVSAAATILVYEYTLGEDRFFLGGRCSRISGWILRLDPAFAYAEPPSS